MIVGERELRQILKYNSLVLVQENIERIMKLGWSLDKVVVVWAWFTPNSPKS